MVVAEINQEAGQGAVREIKQAGGDATFSQVDVSSATDVERMVQTAINTYGRLDILVNNAGVAGDRWEKTTEDDWRRVIDVNLSGVFLSCKYAIPEIKKQGSGCVVNIGSTAGLQGSPRSPAYSASKGAVVLFSKSLARALGKDNVRVNCVCPGPIDTGLTHAFMDYPSTAEEERERRVARLARVPLGRTGRPEDVASLILFLVSDESSFINGVALLIDGGASA